MGGSRWPTGACSNFRVSYDRTVKKNSVSKNKGEIGHEFLRKFCPGWALGQLYLCHFKSSFYSPFFIPMPGIINLAAKVAPREPSGMHKFSLPNGIELKR